MKESYLHMNTAEAAFISIIVVLIFCEIIYHIVSAVKTMLNNNFPFTIEYVDNFHNKVEKSVFPVIKEKLENKSFTINEHSTKDLETLEFRIHNTPHSCVKLFVHICGTVEMIIDERKARFINIITSSDSYEQIAEEIIGTIYSR